MPRNFRHRQTAPPEPKRVSKASNPANLTDDDDDDYAGVDLISDSEEDEPDVEVAEEQAIIDSEEEQDDKDAAPQPNHDDDQSSWAGFEEDGGALLASEPSFFNDHMAHTDPFAAADEWIINNTSDEETLGEGDRRVRFDLSDSDSGSSDVDGIFPQTFLDQNSLDPSFRRFIENDQDNDDGAPQSDTSWDFNGDDPPIYEEHEEIEDSSSCGTSGYETDDGETTDDNLPEEARYLPARKILRRQSTDSDSSSSDNDAPVRRNFYRAQRRGPRLGSWVTDATKPFALMASQNELLMFRAQIGNGRFSLIHSSSRPMTAPGFVEGSDRDTSGTEQMSPMLSNETNLVGEAMSSLFESNPADNLMSSNYAPLLNFGGRGLEFAISGGSFSANDLGIATQNSSSFEDDTVDEFEVLALGDLIHMDDSDDEDDGEEEEEDSSPTKAYEIPSTPGLSSSTASNRLVATPTDPTTANSEDQIHPLLNHLGRGVAGAFRQNQARHHLLSRSIATRESLDFSGPLHHGTLRGIKSDRLEAANAPITPSRKFKELRTSATIMQPTIPVANGAKKRKGSPNGLHSMHKRNRSAV